MQRSAFSFSKSALAFTCAAMRSMELASARAEVEEHRARRAKAESEARRLRQQLTQHGAPSGAGAVDAAVELSRLREEVAEHR
eukprot:SAG11_NODE_37081_length_258_cov_0.981132_1_plen_82_part_10